MNCGNTKVRKDQNLNIIIIYVAPGGMYWQDPVAFTRTFVWNVASNLSSALWGERRG